MSIMEAHPNIYHYGTGRAPEWAEGGDGNPVLHWAEGEPVRGHSDNVMIATVEERTDDLGYVIQTWNDAVGLTTFWSALDYADAVAFADAVVERAS